MLSKYAMNDGGAQFIIRVISHVLREQTTVYCIQISVGARRERRRQTGEVDDDTYRKQYVAARARRMTTIIIKPFECIK